MCDKQSLFRQNHSRRRQDTFQPARVLHNSSKMKSPWLLLMIYRPSFPSSLFSFPFATQPIRSMSVIGLKLNLCIVCFPPWRVDSFDSIHALLLLLFLAPGLIRGAQAFWVWVPYVACTHDAKIMRMMSLLQLLWLLRYSESL